MVYTPLLPSKDSGSQVLIGKSWDIQNDFIKFGREPLHSTRRHSTTPTTRRRSEQFAGWSENNFCQVDRKEHWKNCRCAWSKDDMEQSTVWSYLKFLDFDMLSAQSRNIIKLTIAIQASFALLQSSKNIHKNRKMTFHIFPAATCSNNSTNKKPQRSIAIHRLLTFSFAACGNTTGPWRRWLKGGKTRGVNRSIFGNFLSGSYIGVLKSCEKKVDNSLRSCGKYVWLFFYPCILKSNQSKSKGTLCVLGWCSMIPRKTFTQHPTTPKHPENFRLKKKPVTVESTCHQRFFGLFSGRCWPSSCFLPRWWRRHKAWWLTCHPRCRWAGCATNGEKIFGTKHLGQKKT